MIQSIPFPTFDVEFSSSDNNESAFRNWMVRRDAARSQMRRLSRRELQVVHLVSTGLANKTIALQLQISVKTIEKHRANAARKLGVSSTAEMVRITVQSDQDGGDRGRVSAPSSLISAGSLATVN